MGRSPYLPREIMMSEIVLAPPPIVAAEDTDIRQRLPRVQWRKPPLIKEHNMRRRRMKISRVRQRYFKSAIAWLATEHKRASSWRKPTNS